jgi:acetamidase/formamidase
MQRITREQARKYAFDWRDEPLLRVKPGETFEIETYDASTGYFRTPEDLAIPAKRPGFDRVPVLANPIGGPVWVEGAERGDTLVVSIEDIIVDSYSWVAVGPRRGPLGESTRWPEVSGRYTTKIFRTRRGRAARPATARSTSATASAGRSRRSSAPSAWRPSAR